MLEWSAALKRGRPVVVECVLHDGFVHETDLYYKLSRCESSLTGLHFRAGVYVHPSVPTAASYDWNEES